MPELPEESSLEHTDFRRLLEIARRRYLQFLIPLFVGWFAIWGVSWLLSPRYKSSARILVQTPATPQDYVDQNASEEMQTHLQSISQQILSQLQLQAVIGKERLYQSQVGETIPYEKVELMRKDINVDLVRDTQRGNIYALKISYSANDPRVAQRVTSDLTELFINESNRVNREESEGTTNFLATQVEQARIDLSAQEGRLREFENQHQGVLPTQQTGNLQLMGGVQGQLQNEQDGLNTAKQQRTNLMAMLEEERATSKNRAVSGTSVGSAQVPVDLTEIDAQLDRLRTQLVDLSSRYTDRYPDVRSLKNQIAKTEATRARVVAAMKQNSAGIKPGEQASVNDVSDGAAVRQLQRQLQANQAEIANRENAIVELKTKISEYQGRLNSAPVAEQQLEDLTRNYDQSRANYDDLLKKRDQSAMATNMEQMQQGERFSVLDPPSLPTKPDSPDHLKFFGIGLGGGLLLGIIVAAGFELLDDRLYTEEEIKVALPVSVLAEIPEIISAADEKKARKNSRLKWVTTALVIVIILGGAMFSYFHG